ncbi:MAG: hypothetical protein IJ237_01495 [Oscillospiraceae bacterium]|nr:hypothetical protein [Oscillospiraceae bacterium]
MKIKILPFLVLLLFVVSALFLLPGLLKNQGAVPSLEQTVLFPVPLCAHPSHDPETQRCTVCGQLVCHEYIGGICSCGKAFTFTTDYFDPSLWDACEEKGTVETVEYETKDVNGNVYRKQMEVYLPYGYSADRKYNVLLLLHGSGGDEHYWFKERGYVYPWGDSPWEKFSTVLDNMINRKLCHPAIVVSPTYYLGEEAREMGGNFENDVQQMRYEVIRDILPAVVNRYSTYASGSDYSSLCAARDHFGFLGASYGGMLCCNAILTYDIDVFSWFAAVSGLYANVPEMNAVWEDLGFQNLKIRYLYTSAGDQDRMLEDTQESFSSLLRLSPKITEENSCFVQIMGAQHEERVWDNAVYDCLQFFFNGV